MKRIISIILFCLLSIATVNAQFAFRVSGNGLAKPSYIFGSIHILPSEHLTTFPAFTEADSCCEQLYVESNVKNQQQEAERISDIKDILTLPDSMTIFDVMGEEKMTALQDCLMKSNHLDLRDSTAVQLRNMKPMFFTSLLSSLIQIEALRQYPELAQSKGNIMDVTCITRAESRGWKIGELDQITKEEFKNNVDALLNKQSIEEQVDTLMSLVNNFEQQKQKIMDEHKILSKMIDCWKRSDYDGFESNFISETEKNPELIIGRNKKWVPIMVEAMKEKPTMFVFGSLHLIGPSGIVCLLSEAGYRVEAVF